MNEERLNKIKKQFEGKVPERSELYTNKEIVNMLQDIERTMISGVYEKTHAEHMKERDLMIHFARLADEYGLKETFTYKRFEENMKDLGYTIATYIKGMKGEQLAKKALKLLSYDEDIKILYNISLEDEDIKAEYDAIVITTYGLFVVEVKNWDADMNIDENGILKIITRDVRYNLADRMGTKEALLREYIGKLFPSKYQGVLLLPNINAKITDDFNQIPITYGGGIVNFIRRFNKKEILSKEQIEEICEMLMSNHKECRAICKVNCEEIIEDYALLMAAIEEAAEGSEDSVLELTNTKKELNEEMKIETNESEAKDKDTKKVVFEVVGAAVVFGVGVLLAKKFRTRR